MLRSGKNIEIMDVAKMFSNNITVIPERKGERFISEELPSDTEEALGWKPERTLEEWVTYVKTR
jgi:hypothetical protein